MFQCETHASEWQQLRFFGRQSQSPNSVLLKRAALGVGDFDHDGVVNDLAINSEARLMSRPIDPYPTDVVGNFKRQVTGLPRLDANPRRRIRDTFCQLSGTNGHDDRICKKERRYQQNGATMMLFGAASTAPVSSATFRSARTVPRIMDATR